MNQSDRINKENSAHKQQLEMQTKKIQQIALSSLKKFIEFCNTHNIQYCILGGTVLGAIRHKSFIPWDDDIDIGLPRNDYEKLISLAKIYPAPYKIECMEISSLYVTPFIKIFDTRTIVTENLVRPLRRGVWIDVFPLDGTFSSKIARGWHVKLTQHFVGALVFKNKSIPQSAYSKNTLLKRLLSLLPEKALIQIIRQLSMLIKLDSAKYFVNMMGLYGNKESMEKKVLLEFSTMEFCGIILKSPKNPEKYLKNLYGDYKKLPPIESRVSHHDFLEVDLGGNETHDY